MSHIEKMNTLWAEGKDPESWGEHTTPKDTLIYKSGHPSQIKDLCAIGHLLDLPARVVGSHSSKSVGLPVGMFHADIWEEETVYFLTRNNFHDLKLVVVSSCPINIDYDIVHTHMTQEQYDETKRSSFEYCRPKPERDPPLPGSHDWDEADYETDAWYAKWGHSTLLRVDGKMYSCGSTFDGYYEGIDRVAPKEVFQRYEYDRSEFCVEVPGTEIEMMRIMRATVRSAQKFVQARREVKRDIEDYKNYSAKDPSELTDYWKKRLGEITERLREQGKLP